MSRECFMQFKVSATDGKARRGEMQFPRGAVQTPAFMPVGTYGTVKGMLPKNPLGRAMFRKLKVYAGPNHDHQAQQPKVLEI